MALPLGTIIFTNGGTGDGQLYYFAPDGTPIEGPVVAPGANGGGNDEHIFQNPTNGIFLTLSDNYDDPTFPYGELWDIDFVRITGLADGGEFKGSVCTAVKSGNFYSSGNPTAYVYPTNSGSIMKFDSTGALIAEYNITSMMPVLSGAANGTSLNSASVAVSPDETIAYWGSNGHATTLGTGVRRWNLSTNTYLGELIAHGGGGGIERDQGIICLQDGTLIVAWSRDGGSSTPASLKRYSASGALLHTYTGLPDACDDLDNGFMPSLSGDASRFNVCYYDTDFNLKWAQLNTYTGEVLAEFSVPPEIFLQFHCEVIFDGASLTCTPAGSLAFLFSGPDGTVVRFLDPDTAATINQIDLPDIPASSSFYLGGMVQLPTGEIMIVEGGSTTYDAYFYTESFELVTIVTGITMTVGLGWAHAANSTSKFYINTNTGCRRFNPDGTDDATFTTTTGSLGDGDRDFIGAAWNDGYVLQNEQSGYWIYKTTIPGEIGSVFLDTQDPNFDYNNQGTLPLQDGSVMGWWYASSGDPDYDYSYVVRVYEADGSLRWETNIGSDEGPIFHFTQWNTRGADASYFWTAVYIDGGASAGGDETVVLYKFDASDGTALKTFVFSGSAILPFRWDATVFIELQVGSGDCVTPPTPPTTPPAILVNTDPCCCDEDTPPGTPTAGRILPPIGPAWSPTFLGLGAIPSALTITLDEEWDY